MARQSFNDGWAYRTPIGPFDAVAGATAVPTPVTLPHDALRDAVRARRRPGPRRGGLLPPGELHVSEVLRRARGMGREGGRAGVRGRHAPRDGVRERGVRGQPRGRVRTLPRGPHALPPLPCGQPGARGGALRPGLPLVLRRRPAPTGDPARRRARAHHPRRRHRHHAGRRAGPRGGRGGDVGPQRRPDDGVCHALDGAPRRRRRAAGRRARRSGRGRRDARDGPARRDGPDPAALLCSGPPACGGSTTRTCTRR